MKEIKYHSFYMISPPEDSRRKKKKIKNDNIHLNPLTFEENEKGELVIRENPQCQQLKKKERKSEKYYDFLSFFVIIKQKEVTNDKISKKKK